MRKIWAHIIFSIALLGAISSVTALDYSYEKNVVRNGGTGIAIDSKKTNHIFRDKVGHLKDTPKNRSILEGVGNNSKYRLGPDKYGNNWHAKLNPDGSQTWVQIRNGKIINGGVNKVPKTFNSETGLSAIQPPK